MNRKEKQVLYLNLERKEKKGLQESSTHLTRFVFFLCFFFFVSCYGSRFVDENDTCMAISANAGEIVPSATDRKSVSRRVLVVDDRLWLRRVKSCSMVKRFNKRCFTKAILRARSKTRARNFCLFRQWSAATNRKKVFEVSFFQEEGSDSSLKFIFRIILLYE